MVDAAAGASPWFCTVSVTANPVPRLTEAGGFVTVVTTRSGSPIVTREADARQLFVSSLSATTAVSSAHASR